MKIQVGIFLGNVLSPLQFAIAMMPLNHVLRKCIGVYKLHKSEGKNYHLMCMDDIKLFTKNEKELETVIKAMNIYSEDIGIEFGIEKYALLIMRIGK